MKAKLIILVFFMALVAINSNVVHAQKIVSVPSSSKSENLPKELDKSLFRVLYGFSQKAEKERAPIVLTDTMALIVGQNYSVYYDWNKKRNDSIHSIKSNIPMEKIKSVNVLKDESALQSRLEANQEPTFITDASKGESARIYKDRQKNEITSIDLGPSEGMSPPVRTYLQVSEIIPSQDWTITEDTLNVLGYLCQKATTSFRGRDYVAWFTLDIPVGEGPWKLYGLPGMILKAEDADGIFHFQAIGITQSTDESIEMPTDRKLVAATLKQLYDYRKNRFKNIAYSFFEAGTLNMYQGKNPVTFNDLEIE